MYARSTTILADAQRLDDGIAHVRDEIMPAVQSMPGCIGLSMLCDRDTGRCIVTTSWDSEDAMVATRERVRDMRQRSVELMGASDASVDEWEMAVMHRMHNATDAACARVTWTRGDPARAEEMRDAFRMSLVPRLDDVPGFCSISLMVDRSGRSCVTAVYDDRGAMEASRPQIVSMREEFARQLGLEVTEVAEFDLAIHHLRVPEMV
ncbi:antibiotic biosynthesis monooxygenase [Geodermatophilus sp. YIM 151500]|uniref:antibiotic biosynthesis monooxygenase n=1 Tax=Geodermatophilus sp. YIM 151500 TaxID=2984531 RepID=UPI0021E4B001|nr:antibiotic biosynthesis monooxygenase [Geodermatophilus sp. YIM 151500]MCV2488272.1 antibiotic biosynthesis monooxygenase [Geodermatophilus sp. YIM 151500]